MKYSAALPTFLIWRENLLSYDNMRFFFAHAQEVKRNVIFHEKIFTKFCLTCSENNFLILNNELTAH